MSNHLKFYYSSGEIEGRGVQRIGAGWGGEGGEGL